MIKKLNLVSKRNFMEFGYNIFYYFKIEPIKLLILHWWSVEVNFLYFEEWELQKKLAGTHSYFIIFMLWLGWVYKSAILSETESYVGFLKQVDVYILNNS